MNILALDIATTTGWARVDRNAVIVGGSEKFAPRSKEHAGQRWLKFRQFLADQREAMGEIHIVYYELATQGPGQMRAAHVFGGFLAVLEAWAAVNNVNLVPVPPAKVKKHWTGKGNADKQAMICAAVAKGFSPVDDNHADALAILSLACELEQAQAPVHIPQQLPS